MRVHPVRFSTVFGSVLLAAIMAACAQAPVAPTATPVAPVPSATSTPLPPPATATPIGLLRADPSGVTGAKRANGSPAECALITIGNVATAFAAETNQPIFGSNQTDHPIFSNERVPTNESYCVFLAFHLSGSASGHTYQLTYWVDTPNNAASSLWEQAWTDAAKGAQAVSGEGDAAFYADGRLSFKKGSTYVTIEVIDSKLDTRTPTAAEQQLEIEKRIAQYALDKM